MINEKFRFLLGGCSLSSPVDLGIYAALSGSESVQA